MKKIFLFTLAAMAGLQLQAQNIDKIITREYTDHLIKTLSGDEMQGRGTFTPGIDKAAMFIESEFKKIGLQPLASEKGFRQTFYKYQVANVSKSIKIDGSEISPENVILAGANEENITLNKSNATVVVLDPEKPFVNQFRTMLSAGKNQIILVDDKFAENFKRYKAYFDKPTTLDEKDMGAGKSAVQVFVLGAKKADEFTVELKGKVNKMALFNVAGMIPGKSKAKELVVFSGHYDHLGVIKTVNGDSIANGADDDASGTTAMIALAKYYKAQKNNERTLIFVAFTAEEIGGFGAKYFSSKLNPDEVVAMFNIEMIGKDSKFGKNTAFITGYDKSDFGKILQKNLAGTEFTFHPDPYTEQNLFYRSDNATLAALGVPAHTISTDQIDVDKFYHTVKDEYSTLDVENILSTIKAIAKSATSIVNGTDAPTRIPKLKQ
ncbi:M20/M25/M40 family metallo-hydrolase [Pedobacter sp. MC2016-05]|uniref:M20/M25/M40 family metallo-hydrolase n=1 Tax=Pedobacter sp. MC2016-05 TaxID=2994474 RepID=UPI002246DA89|nr:M20/M25/M40 family metallo-hydrolase [Pedobacter sp. MC2016-05]MCX2475420.1 M20/M25/M40 family metallo-hydrolase [Pedobacter sp. MC2016-05]